MRRFLLALAGLCAALILGYAYYVARQIERQSNVEEARPVDVIVVLGSAEYRGRPSPVLKARLDHALWLYYQKLAPRILTTGGSGGDPVFTEAEVARDYFVRR